jgi:Rrf2 family protein
MAKVLHIAEAASLAIHSLAIVANTDMVLNVKQIADILHVSRNHLAKVMQLLVKFEFLESNRGPRGGYNAKKDLSLTSMLEVYEMIEGTLDCNFCGISSEICPFEHCIFGKRAMEFTQEFIDYMKNTKISTLKTKELIHVA